MSDFNPRYKPRRKPGPRLERAAELEAIERAPRLVCEPDARGPVYVVEPKGELFAVESAPGRYSQAFGAYQVPKRRARS